MSGELCQTVGTLSLPNVGALPTQITAKYHSLDMTSTHVISTAFGPTSGHLTAEATWTFYIAGRTFSGAASSPISNGTAVTRTACCCHPARTTAR